MKMITEIFKRLEIFKDEKKSHSRKFEFDSSEFQTLTNAIKLAEADSKYIWFFTMKIQWTFFSNEGLNLA